MSIKFSTKYFSTIELLISISIIIILGGMYFLNYNSQKKIMDLRDASNILAQKIRKTQTMVMGHTQLPLGCELFPGERMPVSYGLYFPRNQSFFDIIADKDGQNDYDLGSDPVLETCSCDITNECIERTLFPEGIEIDNIVIDGTSYDRGWINFLMNDLSVIIIGGNYPSIEIDLCVSSDCAANIKRIIINNKGMVEIQN